MSKLLLLALINCALIAFHSVMCCDIMTFFFFWCLRLSICLADVWFKKKYPNRTKPKKNSFHPININFHRLTILLSFFIFFLLTISIFEFKDIRNQKGKKVLSPEKKERPEENQIEFLWMIES